jgi:hypothetical protein
MLKTTISPTISTITKTQIFLTRAVDPPVLFYGVYLSLRPKITKSRGFNKLFFSEKDRLKAEISIFGKEKHLETVDE